MHKKPSTYLRGVLVEQDSKKTISYDPEVIHQLVKSHYDDKFGEPDELLSRNEEEIKIIFKEHFVNAEQVDLVFSKEKLLRAIEQLPAHTASGTDCISIKTLKSDSAMIGMMPYGTLSELL